MKKRFEPPIVATNQMAMNESVASTCCYRTVRSGDQSFYQALAGGYIGSASYVDQKESKNYPTNSLWLNIPGDYETKYTSCELEIISGIPNIVTTGDDGEPIMIPLNKVTSFLSGGASCDHTDTSCAYYTWPVVTLDKAHINATTKHTTSAGDWTKPHAAIQFMS